MKWRILVSVSIVVITLALTSITARADGPTDAQYAMVHCSGLGIDSIVSGEQSFDTAYGFAHNLTTFEQWRGSYVDRTNQFARLIGCGDVLANDGAGAALTLAGKSYGPLYRAILKHEALP